MANKTLIKNIGELVALSALAEQQRTAEVTESDLGILNNAWITIENGKFLDFGGPETLPPEAGFSVIDAEAKCVMPGLVDSHTHPIFAGSRHDEFAMRLDGKTYQQIAEAGGGIKSTVTNTRKASDSQLEDAVAKRFQTFLSKGVTTVEAKSGYGLSPAEEIRELEILNRAAKKTKQEIVVTCLALHALPPEFEKNFDFVKQITEELLPEVAERNLASYVDSFIESGYFSVKDCEPYYEKAAELGLKIRVHADEFTDANAAGAAADWNAASADHLQFASKAGIKKMAEKNVIATILPGTSLYTAIPFTKAENFFSQGCAVAVATDYNPGSCLVDNLPMMATIAALHCGLTTAQAIAAVTYVPAVSLGLGKKKGAISKGFDADFMITDAESGKEWLADMGRTPPKKVFIQGNQLQKRRAHEFVILNI